MADGDVWRGVRGRHGVGCCNEAGEKFLEFCAVNQFTIMSIWFTEQWGLEGRNSQTGLSKQLTLYRHY